MAQSSDQLGRIGTVEGLKDVPAVRSGGMDDSAQGSEGVCTLSGAEAARDLLAELGHSVIALGLVVGEGHTAGTREKAQGFSLALPQAECAVVAGGAGWVVRACRSGAVGGRGGG